MILMITIPKERYRVMASRHKVYAGDDLAKAVAFFCAAIHASVEGEALVHVVEGDEEGSYIREGHHSVTSEPLVEAYHDNQLLAVLYGITWDEWIEHGPTELVVPN